MDWTGAAQRDIGVLRDSGSQARPSAIGSMSQCLNDFTGVLGKGQPTRNKRSSHNTSAARQKSGGGGTKTEERNVTQSFDASPLERAWLRRCVSVARGPWVGATERNLQLVPSRRQLAEFARRADDGARHQGCARSRRQEPVGV